MNREEIIEYLEKIYTRVQDKELWGNNRYINQAGMLHFLATIIKNIKGEE